MASKMRGCKGFNIIFIPSTFTNSKQFPLIVLLNHLPLQTVLLYAQKIYVCICISICTLQYKKLTKVDPITNLKQFIFDSVRIKLYVFIPFIPFSYIYIISTYKTSCSREIFSVKGEVV